MCKSKQDAINVDEATECTGCGSLFHSSCAQKATKNTSGAFTVCCGQDQSFKSSQQLGRTGSTRQLRSGKQTQVANRNNQDIGADDLSSLDPKLIPLWNLINGKFNNIDLKLNDIYDCIDLTKQRMDTLEVRVDSLEETISKRDDNMIDEIRERLIKEKNFIIFNLPDSVHANKTDLATVQNLFHTCDTEVPFSLSDIRVMRLGTKYTAGRIRPLKVSLKNSDDVHWVYRNKSRLGDGKLVIRNDMTKMQLTEIQRVKNELKARIVNEKNLTIKFIKNKPQIVKIVGNRNRPIDGDHREETDELLGVDRQ